jgi:hypothetical protein
MQLVFSAVPGLGLGPDYLSWGTFGLGPVGAVPAQTHGILLAFSELRAWRKTLVLLGLALDTRLAGGRDESGSHVAREHSRRPVGSSSLLDARSSLIFISGDSAWARQDSN